jgi:hypothetical protein
MKRVSAVLAVFLNAVPAFAQTDSNCTNGDPSAVLAGIDGDFELAVDPQDPAQNVIYISNVVSGASSVVVARIDAQSGEVVSGSLHTIANNFNGNSIINGPEFVMQPGGQLGVIYAGPQGVHGVFRPAHPKAWYQFAFDVDGVPTNGAPPALPTSIGAYPMSSNPLGHNTYGQGLGSCSAAGEVSTDSCYAALAFGSATNVDAVMAAQGFTVQDTVQSPRDGHLFISACGASSCGLYEAVIDNAGGFASGVSQLAQTSQAPANIAAGRHPVTGTIVVFSQHGTTAIDVWEQSATGGPLTLIGTVPTSTDSHHYTTGSDASQLVLHYYGPQRGKGGSFTIAVTASGKTLVAGSSKLISPYNNGSELLWLPAADQWAFYDHGMNRCWVTP